MRAREPRGIISENNHGRGVHSSASITVIFGQSGVNGFARSARIADMFSGNFPLVAVPSWYAVKCSGFEVHEVRGGPDWRRSPLREQRDDFMQSDREIPVLTDRATPSQTNSESKDGMTTKLVRPRLDGQATTNLRTGNPARTGAPDFPVDAPKRGAFVRPSFGGKIAQLVEQRTENPCVPGSIPGLATT